MTLLFLWKYLANRTDNGIKSVDHSDNTIIPKASEELSELSYKNGNSEVCTFSSPASGTWHIDLRGYSAANGVSLRVQAD